MAHQNYYKPASSAVIACPLPMTRAALLALRAAGQLRVECHYTVTDIIQGRLVAGTQVVMHAVTATKLSERVEVNSTYDNEAWVGQYDLDRNLVLEVTDNRGNTAKGINGSEVAAFDWGNVAYTGCLVDNATWVTTIGTTQTSSDVEVTTGATLNTTGITGTMANVNVSTAANLNLSGAAMSWRDSEFKNSTVFNATGYTAGGISNGCEFGGCTVNISALTGLAQFRTSEFQNCTMTIIGTTAATFTACSFQQLFVNRPAGGGVLQVLNSTSNRPGSLVMDGTGNLTVTNTRVEGVIRSGGIGLVSVQNTQVLNSGNITNFGTGNVTCFFSTISDQSSQATNDLGSTASLGLNNTHLLSGGQIRNIGAVLGDSLTVAYSRVDQRSSVYKRSPGNLGVSDATLSGQSTIDKTSGDRGYQFQFLTMNNTARAILTGTGAGINDNLNNNVIENAGSLLLSSTGPFNFLSHSEVRGSTGTIALSGTTGTSTFSRLKALGGSITANNCTTNNTIIDILAQEQGAVNFVGLAATKSVSRISASNGGFITINNSTGGGGINFVAARNSASYVVSGSAGNGSVIDVCGGAYAHNGGTSNNIFKCGSGTLTSGAFNQQDITFEINATQTLTAANTNRGRDFSANNLV